MVQGIFQYRKSRRLAEVEVDGYVVDAYMSNGIEMGFLKPGTICFLREADSERRKTAYDLYSAYDESTLVCVDAKEPLRIAMEWYRDRLQKESTGEKISFIDDFRSSSFICYRGRRIEMTVQVMGTSFLNKGNAYLPELASSALNQRLESLLWMKRQGQDPRLLFVICRDDADSFSANVDADLYFAKLLEEVYKADIPVECLRCKVNENGMSPERLIPLKLPETEWL